MSGLIKDVHRTVVAGGRHAIPYAYVGQVSSALLDFLRR